MSKWISFVDNTPKDRKTNIWDVVATDGGFVLGEVRWASTWRCYAFFPYAMMVFEQDCLRDIANWCELETKTYRKRWKRVTA